MATKDWPGGVISKTPVVPAGSLARSAASGVWSLDQVAYWVKQGIWPDPANVDDPYFEYVSMLLTGNGTNGSQNNTFIAFNNAAKGPFENPAGYWSVGFDGNGDQLTIASNTALDLSTGNFTVEAWVNYSAFVNDSKIYIDITDGSNYWQLRYSTVAGLQLVISGGTVVCSQGSISGWSLGTWYHVALVRSGDTFTIYRNGTPIAVGTRAGSIGSFNVKNIGGWTGSAATSVNGYISNLRIVKGTAVYNSNFVVPTNPLTVIGGTSLLTCQGNVICDASNNKLAITTNGNAAVNDQTPFAISSAYNPYSFSGYFDGSGDYLTTAYSTTAFDWWTSDYTIEAWVLPNTLTGWVTSTQPTLIGNTTATSSTNYWSFGPYTGNTIAFYYYTGSTITVSSTATLVLGRWNHIAMTNSSAGIRLWVNGVGSAPSAISGTPQSSAGVPLTIGQFNNAAINGYVSNIRIVKGTAVYTNNFTPSNEPLTAISGTQLLTCQSATFVDNSPNAFTITVNGNTTVATASNSGLPITRNGNTTQGTFSPYGNLWSNYFDGSGDYLSVPNNAALSPEGGDFTIEAWIYVSTLPTTYSHIYCSNPTNGVTTYINSSGIVSIGYANVSTIADSSTAVLANTWNHVAFTRSGSTVRIFINGTQQASVTNSTTFTSTVVGTIGYVSSFNYFTGYISNLRIVKGTALYTSNFTPSTTPLTAVSGTSLLTCQSNRFIDNSSNNFTLTVNGNTSVQRFSPFNPTAPYSASTIGGSGYFDGTGDALTIASNAAFGLPSNFTFEAWVYSSASNGIIYLTMANEGLIVYINNGYITVRRYAVADVITSSALFPLNQWTHIAVCRSGTTLSLYINGSRANGGTTSNSTSFAQGEIRIGYSETGSNGLNGYVSNLRLVKGTAVYDPTQSTITVPTTPLTAITNTSLLCNFTNAGIPDAAMMNDLETVGNAQVSTSVKKYGTGSLAFDGSGDWLQLPYTPNLQFTGNFTVECWVNPTSKLNAYPCIIGNYSTFTTNGGFAIFAGHNSGSTTKFNVSFNGSFPAITSTSNIAYGSWQHLALVRNGSTITLYVNGVAEGTTTSSATVTGTANYWWIGTAGDDTAGGAYNGYIDDLRITKGVARYTANFTPPTADFPTY